jgi:site-specific DNA-methyltransferase (adenine-specific)
MTKSSGRNKRAAAAATRAAELALPAASSAWQVQLQTGDNLTLLAALSAESVDLIYADPPFNSGHAYYATGRRDEGPRFQDTWRWDADVFDTTLRAMPDALAAALAAFRTVLGPGADCAYCAFLAPRLIEFKRLLKPSGSLYLHGDARMSHCVRLMADAVFGREHFRNEIAWAYRTGGAGKRQFARKHDAILFYSASRAYTFHAQYERVRYGKPFFSAQQDADGFYADVLLRDVWEIPAVINVSKERSGYPTQKPLALLERIVLASSNPGDLVLDPFCGSGTTLIAAIKHGRRALGMDANPEAIKIARERLALPARLPV